MVGIIRATVHTLDLTLDRMLLLTRTQGPQHQSHHPNQDPPAYKMDPPDLNPDRQAPNNLKVQTSNLVLHTTVRRITRVSLTCRRQGPNTCNDK